jgi:putative MFS transporter
MMPIIQKEWQLTSSDVSILSSVFYFGMFVGAILSGQFADKYGRRITIIIATFT